MVKNIIYICFLVLFSCSSINFEESTKTTFDSGKISLSKGKYNKAKSEFEFVILNSPLSSYASESYFYLAESKFHLEKYEDALSDYEKYLNLPIRDISLSKKAQLMICKSWFNLSNDVLKDQTDTRIAIDKLQYYIEKDSMEDYVSQIENMILSLRNKLAEKDFKTALLYMRLDKIDSAQIYFESIIKEYYDSQYVNESIFNIALIKAKEDKQQAINYLNLNKHFFSSDTEFNEVVKLINQ
tara:strand:+ start:874 stop:1596 length:723 start_codon:yes stop_codon:yes gene_type:complete